MDGRKLNLIAASGLAAGAVFGLAGTLVNSASLRGVFWGIDGVGLVVGSSLLTVKFLRRGNDIAAAGFLSFGIGQGLVVSGAAASLRTSVPSFGAGVALWAAGLLLVAASGEFPGFVRMIGAFAALLFAIVAGRIFWGEELVATSSPLPFFAYPFLVLTIAGWIWVLVRESSPSATGVSS